MMTRKTLSTLFALTFCLVLVGCSDSKPSSIMDGASEDDVANYEKLLADAEADLAGDTEDKDFEK